MLELSDILMLCSLPALLILSGFFSGTETALFSLTRHQQLVLERSKSFVGSAIKSLLSETRSLLITILLANMLINVLYFTICAVLLMGFKRSREVNPLIITALGVLPLLVLIAVGEVLPKLFAVRTAVGWARITALPMMIIHRGLAPIRIISNRLIITPLARLIAPSTRPEVLSPEELQSLLEASQQQGVIDINEEKLLQQVLSLSQYKVKDLMNPRVDIHAFDLDDQPSDLLALIRESRRSHIPVYYKNLDHIEGVIHSRQFLLTRPQTRDHMKQLIRQITFVPELERADQLLIDFRKRGVTLAIAVDEYGGTAGLITLEDIVELMVGDITRADEQPVQPQVQAAALGVWRVSANLSIHQWADVFSQKLVSEGVSTIGGLVMSRLGRLPHKGDRVLIGNVDIEVETMKGRRIDTLLIKLQNHDEAAP